LPATLKIYNVLGKVVRTLVNEPMAPGDHQVIWDGKDDQGNQAASGIYFYKLRAGDFQDTKKMVLMK
jgi:flagellar hook assembly protein FlgD